MPAMVSPLSGLRRSLLGAWLAVAYAWAVLAAALAPAATAASVLDGTVLCSGMAMPSPDTPGPAAEGLHCKGCPLQPLLTAPEAPTAATPMRRAQHLAFAAPTPKGLPAGSPDGLAQPRAPPGASQASATFS